MAVCVTQVKLQGSSPEYSNIRFGNDNAGSRDQGVHREVYVTTRD